MQGTVAKCKDENNHGIGWRVGPSPHRDGGENLILQKTKPPRVRWHMRGSSANMMQTQDTGPMPYSILVIEDDPNDIFLLKRALRKNNISNPVQVLTDGAEAIAYLTGFGQYVEPDAYPRFILLDLKMPRRSGFEVLEWMQNHPRFGSIPKIVLTSSSERKDVAQAFALGATSYMVKPADFHQLEQMIRTIFDYWTACLQPGPAELSGAVT